MAKRSLMGESYGRCPAEGNQSITVTQLVERQFAEALGHHQGGELDAAERAYKKLLKRCPHHLQSLANLGMLMRARGRAKDALKLLKRALQTDTRSAVVLNELGLSCLQLERFDEAEAWLRRSIEADPSYVIGLYNLAGLLMTRGQYDAALRYYQDAAQRAPNSASAHDAVGNAWLGLDELASARQSYETALRVEPDFAPAMCHLGDVDRAEGTFAAACSWYDKALASRPDYALARWHRAMALLASGDFARGWPEYEARFQAGASTKADIPLPEWRGERLTGRRILVAGEQGVGDEIMFAACLPELVSMAERVVLICEPRLASLFQRSFPMIEVRGVRDGREFNPEFTADADTWAPAGGLPRHVWPDPEIFGPGRAYLRPAPEVVEKWRARYAALGPGQKVGISWRGGGGELVRRRRSVLLSTWSDALRGADAHWVNLQYGDCTEELREARGTLGLDVADWDDADPLTDLDDFAAQVAALDLVISVDNATVHMAGALGTPVWALLPRPADWRWMTGREDSPWYPGVRLFRQEKPGDWSPVLARVREELGALTGGRAAVAGQPGPACAAPPARKAVLLNDTSAWYHWGCTCTSSALKEEIVRRGFTLDAVPISAVYECSETPDRIADFKDPAFYERFRTANCDVVAQLADADVVVINGEGTLHGTGPAVLNLLYLAYAAKTRLGCRVQIVNHSCFPEDSPQVRHSPASALYKLVYDTMDTVAVREPISAKILDALGVSVIQAFDSLPLYVEAHYTSENKKAESDVVLAGSVAWRAEALPILSDLIGHLHKLGHTVSVLVGAQAHPARDDAALVAALKDASPTGWKLIDAGSAREWLDALDSAPLLISGRYHHTIAALSLGTPCVVLNSNTPKMEGMLNMVGQPPPLSFSESGLRDRLFARVEEALSERSHNSLPGLRQRVCALARQNFAGLDALVGAAAVGE